MTLYRATAEGQVLMTPEEEMEFLAEQARNVESQRKAGINAQIAALEVKITPRRMREALLTGDTSYISMIESQIAALRIQL